MLTGAQRAVLEPLIEACRPKGKTTLGPEAHDLSYSLRPSERREVALIH